MDHDAFTDRLSEIGIRPEDLPRSTLRNWAREGLIPRPSPYTKKGRRGRFRNWPDEAVEEAAAVWALRNFESDRFLSPPSSDTVKRVKFEAVPLHEMVKNDVRFYDKAFQKCFDTQGREFCYLKSYDLHPFIVTWIATIEKVRHKKSIREPAQVIFNWKIRVVHEGDKDLLKLRYDGVTLKPSANNSISQAVGEYTAEAWEKRFGKKPIDWEQAEREGTVITFDKNTDWNNVQEDVEHQQITITDPLTKKTTTIDLKNGSLRMLSPEEWAEIENSAVRNKE